MRIGDSRSFTFDRVFDQRASQPVRDVPAASRPPAIPGAAHGSRIQDVYTEAAPLVEACLEYVHLTVHGVLWATRTLTLAAATVRRGYNATVLAYGQVRVRSIYNRAFPASS